MAAGRAGGMGDGMTVVVDIEPTNRCNAKCYFCPRDATPHQGLMAREVFEQALGRVVDLRARFRDLADDECEIFIVLVDHRGDPQHLADMRQYWGDQGLHAFMEYEIMNRGGALFVDHMQFEEYPQLAEARTLLHANGIEAVCPT